MSLTLVQVNSKLYVNREGILEMHRAESGDWLLVDINCNIIDRDIFRYKLASRNNIELVTPLDYEGDENACRTL